MPTPATQPEVKEATHAQHIAGALLPVHGFVLLGVAGMCQLNGQPMWRVAAAGGVGLVDIVLGFALLRAHGSLAWAGLARALVVGPLLATALVRPFPALAAFQIVASAALIALLFGAAGKARIALGSIVLAIACVATPALALFAGNGELNLSAALMRAAGQIKPLPSNVVAGESASYTVTVPNLRWHLRSDSLAKRDNPLSDRWLIRPDLDAHVLIIAEHVPGSIVPIDPYTDQVLENARKAASRFEIVSREPLASQATRARVVRARATVSRLDIQYCFAVFSSYDRGFQVVAFAPEKSFDKARADIDAIIASFRMPRDATDPLPPPDVEPASAGHVTGIEAPYSLDAANDRWHLRKADAVKKDNPIIDRWLVRYETDAHLFVIAEQVPGAVLDVDRYADAVLGNLRERSSEVEIVGREPISAGAMQGRLMHLRAKVEGKDVEYLYGLYASRDRGFQVVAFAGKTLFPSVEQDLRAMIKSFKYTAEK